LLTRGLCFPGASRNCWPLGCLKFQDHVICSLVTQKGTSATPASPLFLVQMCNSSSSSFPSQPQPTPKQTSSILHPLPRACLPNVHRALHPTSTAALYCHFFESRFAKQSLIPSRQTRDTAHQSQSQLAFLSIEFRIAADCALDLFFCLVLLILTVRSATSSSPPHTQSRCLPDSISLSTRSYPLNDDLPVVAEADVFIALRPPLPRQPVVLRKTPSMPRVLSRIFLQDRRAQVVKARF